MGDRRIGRRGAIDHDVIERLQKLPELAMESGPSAAASPLTAAGKGRSSGAAAAQRVAVPCGSASATMTRPPRRASSPARCMARVVLPGPPFWLTRAMMRAGRMVISAQTIQTIQMVTTGLTNSNIRTILGTGLLWGGAGTDDMKDSHGMNDTDGKRTRRLQ